MSMVNGNLKVIEKKKTYKKKLRAMMGMRSNPMKVIIIAFISLRVLSVTVVKEKNEQ
jgi:hypothetical protein